MQLKAKISVGPIQSILNIKFCVMMERVEKILAYLAENPQDNFLQHALALEYIKIGEEDKARELFETLLQRDPSYTGSYYHLAKLLERKGEREEAIKVYRKGMEMTQQSGDRHALNELRSALEELEDD